MGRADHRELLSCLGRAARVPALALATMASGPCGCPAYETCHRVGDLLVARDDAVAANGTAGTASPTYDTHTLLTAQSWDGTGCPDVEQYEAIARLSHTDGVKSDDGATFSKSEGDRCCYNFEPSCDGRPFLVAGVARVAGIIATRGTPMHAALAEAWLADALAEHASVAAFARLTLQLMALGAPGELVQRSQLASLDELRHAQYCFERAGRYGGVRYAPAALPMSGALDDCSLAALIESNLLEGCIGETLASERLRCRAELTRDEDLRAALLGISDDERRHAELAFAVLAWCRELSPDATRSAITRVLAGRRCTAARAEHDEDALYVNERATSAALHEREREVWQEVLEPLLHALCQSAAA